jgi:hypothetical protein
VDPTQANWQGTEGEPQKLNLNFEFRPDGSVEITDDTGNYSYEAANLTEAQSAISGLCQHGQKRAQGE